MESKQWCYNALIIRCKPALYSPPVVSHWCGVINSIFFFSPSSGLRLPHSLKSVLLSCRLWARYCVTCQNFVSAFIGKVTTAHWSHFTSTALLRRKRQRVLKNTAIFIYVPAKLIKIVDKSCKDSQTCGRRLHKFDAWTRQHGDTGS